MVKQGGQKDVNMTDRKKVIPGQNKRKHCLDHEIFTKALLISSTYAVCIVGTGNWFNFDTLYLSPGCVTAGPFGSCAQGPKHAAE